MNAKCRELAPRLAARPLGVLEADESKKLDAHVKSCADCRAFVKKVEAELVQTKKPEREVAPESAWDRIAQRIELERSGRRAQIHVRVSLACTFCHDGLKRDQAVYCASCLAPHHADCFERHGRCSAPGCGETKTVSPSTGVARPVSRNRPFLIFAIAGGAVAAAALTGVALKGGAAPSVAPTPVATSSTQPSPVASAPKKPLSNDALAELSGEPEEDPKPYPWVAASGEAAKKLRSQRVTFNFAATPISEVFNFLQDITGVNLVIDPAIDQEQTKINLRLKDTILWDALLSIVEQANVGFACDGARVTIAPRDKLPKDSVYPRDFDVEDLVEERRDAALEFRARLQTQMVTVNFDQTPFEEVIEFFRDISGLNFVIEADAARALEETTKKISHREKDVAFDKLLDVITAHAGLAWRAQRGIVFITMPRVQAPAPAASAATRVSISLRGVRVPELVAALAAQGVEAVATEETWSSRGTFSLVVKDEPLDSFAKTIAATTPLRAFVIQTPRGQRLLLDGIVSSVRAALRVKVPPFTGIAAELADLRARLGPEIAARAAARADAATPADELILRERAVDLSTTQILALTSRAAAVARAPAEREEVGKAVIDVRQQRDKLKEELDAVKAKQKTELDAAEAAVAAHQLELETVRKDEAGAKNPTVDSARALELQKKTAQDGVDAAQKELARLKRNQANQLVRLENEVVNRERRVDELTRQLGALDVDLAVGRRLERGARLAEAEQRK